jgi:hypothetical protein
MDINKFFFRQHYSDRTLSLLFQGSKIKQGDNSPASNSIPHLQTISQPPSKFSQTILTSDGQYHVDTKGQAMKGIADQATPFTCRSCCSVDFQSLERCNFCEGLYCESCCRPCSTCGGEYCNKCSMKM